MSRADGARVRKAAKVAVCSMAGSGSPPASARETFSVAVLDGPEPTLSAGTEVERLVLGGPG